MSEKKPNITKKKQSKVAKPDGRVNNGRPEIEIDWDFVNNQLKAWATGTTIAAKLGIAADTLYLKVEQKFNMAFSAYQQLKRIEGNDEVQNTIHQEAVNGNPTMAIWWDKTRNGMKETTDHNINTNQPQMTTEQMIAILQTMQKANE